MNTIKHLKEALNTLMSVRLDDSAGLSNLTTEQITALAKLEGKLSFMVEWLEEEENKKLEEPELVSNCCSSGVYENSDICMACKEHCAVEETE